MQTPRRKIAPLFPDCWNGSCDIQPRPAGAPEGCSATDADCLRRKQACPNGQCENSVPRLNLPEGVQDVTGFAGEHVVLYVVSSVPARSWAALRLGAPEGLAPGYHLARVLEHDSDTRSDASVCLENVRTEIVDRHNAEHGTRYTVHGLECQRTSIFICDAHTLPTGAESRQLAAAIAAAEVESGCMEMAPELETLPDPAAESVTVRMGEGPPRWVPNVPLRRVPIPSDDP